MIGYQSIYFNLRIKAYFDSSENVEIVLICDWHSFFLFGMSNKHETKIHIFLLKTTNCQVVLIIGLTGLAKYQPQTAFKKLIINANIHTFESFH